MAAFAGAAPSDLVAQTDPDLERYWLAAGIGGGVLEEEAGAAFSVDAVYQRDARLFGVHAAAVLGGYELSHVAVELGLLYGRSSRGAGARRWSAATGLSFVQVDISGRRLRNTLGLPLVVQGSLDSPMIGVGVGGFANLNVVEPYAGVVATLRLGRLR